MFTTVTFSRNLLDEQELKLLKITVESDFGLQAGSYGRDDG